MMMELENPLKQGDKPPVTLQFEKARKVAVKLDVQGVGAQGPGGAASKDGMKTQKMNHSRMKVNL
jgi:hypothetical protein